MKEIRSIIQLYDQLKNGVDKLALATVVRIEESSYRRVGARMLVSSSGQWTGGISGGCLEGDALRRAQKAIFDNKPSTVTYDTMDDDANQIGVGLGCNGIIEVLFTPIDTLSNNNSIEQLRQIVEKNDSAILLQLINSSNKQDPIGQTQLFDSLTQAIYFDLETNALTEEINKVRIKRRPQIVEVSNVQGIKRTILIEYLRPETRLVVIGDNYDVRVLLKIASELGWDIHWVGRKKKMTKSSVSLVKKIYEYEEIDQVPKDEFTAVVLMTHDYEWDKRILPKLMGARVVYLGMLGPKKRWIKLSEDLGIARDKTPDKFHTPVGLDIGAETPEEITISILSEIIATMRQREGRALRERKGTIHDRIQS